MLDIAAGALVAVDVAALVYTGMALGRRLEPHGDFLDRAVAGSIAALAALAALLTGAAMVGVVHRPVIIVAPLALAAGASALRHPVPDASERKAPHPRLWAVIVLTLAGVGVAAGYLGPGLAGRSESVDTNGYHVVNLAEYAESGSIWTVPFSQPGYFTGAYPNAHGLVTSVLFAATDDDRLVYVINGLWAAVGVLGITWLGRLLGGSTLSAATIGVAIVAIPVVRASQAAALTTDLVAAAGITIALGALLRARTHTQPAAALLVGGCALGLAVGSKYTALGAAAALMIVAIARFRWRSGFLLAPVVVLVVPWLVRNLVSFRNPFFPLDLGPLVGGSSPLTVYEAPMWDHLVHGRGAILMDWARLARMFLGPALAVIPVAFVVAWRERRPDHWTVFAVGVAAFGFYLVTPYTGGGVEGATFLIGSQLRYALPAVFIFAGLAAAWRYSWALGGLILLWSAWRLLEGAGHRGDVDLSRSMVVWAAALAAVAAVFALPAARRLLLDFRVPWPVLAGVVSGVVAAGALAVQAPRSTVVDQLVDAHGGGRRTVAPIGVINVRTLMGNDFGNELVAIVDVSSPGGGAILDPGALDAAIDQADPVVVALPRVEHLTVPGAWVPSSDWVLADQTHGMRLYVRAQ